MAATARRTERADHVIYRSGEELSVRLPRHPGAIGQARKEFQWLPRLAPHLPLAIPVPLGVGDPDFGYPWPWAVSRWLDGEVATVDALGDSSRAAHSAANAPASTARRAFAGADAPSPPQPDRVRDPAVPGCGDQTAARLFAMTRSLPMPSGRRSPGSPVSVKPCRS